VGRPLGSAYLLTEPIGRGAMGRVWRGVRRVDGSAVAVKVLRPELADDPDAVARFLTERSALRAVVDPHVVRVHDLVVEGSILAIVMDLVSGGDLRSALRAEGRLAPGPAIEAIGGVAAGLVAVHRAGIVHRDVKPENVLVTAGDPPVRLTDFGIARVVDGASLTRPTQLVGTPDYVAPELAAGRPPSPASDVYALGVMAYELLAGRRPFVGPSPAAVLRAHLDEAPVPPPGLDPGVWAMVAACLDKDPARRPAADEVAGWCRRAAPALEGHPRLDPVPAPPARPEASVGAVDPLSAPAVPVPPVALAGPAGDHDGGRLETRAGRRPADPAPPAAPAARRRWPWLLGAAVLALVLGVGGFATAQRDEDASPPSTDEEGSTTSDGVEIGFVGLPVDEAILQSNGRVVVRYAQPTVEDEGTSLTLVLVPADDDPAAPERQRQADFDGAGGASRDPGESDDAVLPFDEDEDGVNDAISIDPAGFDLDLEADPGACVRILHPYRGAKPEPADLGVRAFATDCTEISE
jgi:serine/threonine-protein kinase